MACVSGQLPVNCGQALLTEFTATLQSETAILPKRYHVRVGPWLRKQTRPSPQCYAPKVVLKVKNAEEVDHHWVQLQANIPIRL